MEIPIELHTQCDWPHIREDFEHILPEQFHSYNAKQNMLNFSVVRAGVQQPELFTRPLTEDDMLTDQMDYISMLKILHQSGSIFLQQHFRTVLLENNSVFPLTAVLSYDSQCPSGENPDKYMHQLADDEIERVDDSSQVKKKST